MIAEKTQDLLFEEIFGDDIVDIRPLGKSGGLSHLYRGYKKGLDVEVVIKRVKSSSRGKINEKQEANILVALRHQYLPKIYDFKRDSQGCGYIVMEFIEGETLAEYIQRKGAISQKETLRFCKQLCEAMRYMHSRKPKAFIHSDLKPANVMITPTGDICVIDFNTSLEEQENLQAIGVSQGFAAPEQYNIPMDKLPENHPMKPYAQQVQAQHWGGVTPATDIYSIGALAYYMLTGYVPAVWADGIVPLNRYAIVLGNAFRQVIERAMQPNPQKRFSSAGEMLKALNNLNKLDSRYKAWLRKVQAVCLLFVVGFAAGILLLFHGFNLQAASAQGEYLQLVDHAAQLRNENQYTDSQQILKQAIEQEPQRMEAYIELAVSFYQQGEYQQVIDLLVGEKVESKTGRKEVLEQLQGQMYYLQGNSYMELGMLQEAVKNMELAVWLLPDNTLYRRDLAICYAKNQQWDLAQQELNQLKENSSQNNGDTLLIEGEIFAVQGNFEQAISSFVSATQQLTDLSSLQRAYLQASKCYEAMGTQTIDQQIQLLTDATAKLTFSVDTTCMEELAMVYLRKASIDTENSAHWYQESLNVLNQVLERGYQKWSVLLNKALVLQYLDDFSQAEQVLLQLQKDYPNNYQVPMRLTLLYLDQQLNTPPEQRDYTNVLQMWEQAQKLYGSSQTSDPEMTQIQQTLQQLGL